MGFIPCISECKHQKDGVCTLENAFSGDIASDSGCIHYVPKNLTKYSTDKIKKNPGIDQLRI